MKRYMVIAIIVFCLIFANTKVVYANIMCNDGTESPTCSDCHQGCCSWHGGCANSRSSYSRSRSTDYEDSDDDSGSALVPLLVGGGGIAAAVAYNKSKKK